MKLDSHFMSYIKVNVKWVIDLNVKSKTMKFIEENTKEFLHALRVGDDFLRNHKK